jgi:hypothetical protein
MIRGQADARQPNFATLRLGEKPRAQQDRIPPNPGYGPIPHQKANVGT